MDGWEQKDVRPGLRVDIVLKQDRSSFYLLFLL
jgi:uncharacterized protein YwbE